MTSCLGSKSFQNHSAPVYASEIPGGGGGGGGGGTLLLSESVGMRRPLDPPFSPQEHPLVGYSNVKNTPVGYHFFVLSHSLWVIFVKFSYLATLLGSFLWKFDTPVGVKIHPVDTSECRLLNNECKLSNVKCQLVCDAHSIPGVGLKAYCHWNGKVVMLTNFRHMLGCRLLCHLYSLRDMDPCNQWPSYSIRF